MAYRTVHERFWRDPKVLGLSPKEKLLFVYLITSADAHYSGVYYCPLQIMQLETGLSEKDVREGIDTLSIGCLIEYDRGSNEVFVLNMAKFQVVSAQQIKGVANHFKETVQSQALKQSFMTKYDSLSIPYQIGIDTTETERETERETQTYNTHGDKSPDIIPDKRNKFSDIDKPDNVDQQVWDDFVKNRRSKKAPITKTAFNKIIKEAEKAGITLNEALKINIEKCWRGFEAEWLTDKKLKQTGLFGNNCAEQKSELLEAIERRKREDEEKAKMQIDDPDLPF